MSDEAKKGLKQKIITQETDAENNSQVAVISAGDGDSFTGLSAGLAEIRKLKGVIGYILRSSTSAIVDLNEQEKIIPYAVLSSEICDVGLQFADQFKLGAGESVLVEGKKIKVLCINMGENKISIFMEKSASHAWITKRIRL